MFQITAVEKIGTHILFSITSVENRASYEIIWKNVVERGMAQMTLWCMRIARWIPKATKYTLSLCNIYCFSPATSVAGTHLNVTVYVHCLVHGFPHSS